MHSLDVINYDDNNYICPTVVEEVLKKQMVFFLSFHTGVGKWGYVILNFLNIIMI